MVRKKKTKSVKYWLHQAHLYLALVLCIPLVLLGLTGSILVFQHELEDMVAVKNAAPEGTPHAVSEIIAAAQKYAPEGLEPSTYRAPENPGDAASVRFSKPGSNSRSGGKNVRIDPVTLEQVKQERGALAVFLRTVNDLHANLLTEDRSGRTVIGYFGLVMLFLGVSGIVMWWPKKGKVKAAFVMKRGAKGLRFHRDLHSVVGIWGLVVFVLVSFSGVYLAFPKQTGAVVRTFFPARDFRELATQMRVEPVKGEKIMNVDEVISMAQAGVGEGYSLLFAAIPSRQGQPYRISFAPPGHVHGLPMTNVFVDPYRAKVVETHDPQTYSTGETILAWQHGLHAGQGLGSVWKGLVFVCGFLPLLFSITGVVMWMTKRNARKKSGRNGKPKTKKKQAKYAYAY